MTNCGTRGVIDHPHGTTAWLSLWNAERHSDRMTVGTLFFSYFSDDIRIRFVVNVSNNPVFPTPGQRFSVGSRDNNSLLADISKSSDMKPIQCVFVALSLYAMMSGVAAGCKYSVESYTTTDAMIVTEAAFIAQVSAECEDSPSNLYAEVEGKLVVAANAGPKKYQVCYYLIYG